MRYFFIELGLWFFLVVSYFFNDGLAKKDNSALKTTKTAVPYTTQFRAAAPVIRYITASTTMGSPVPIRTNPSGVKINHRFLCLAAFMILA